MIPQASPDHVLTTKIEFARSRQQCRRHGRGILYTFFLLLLLSCIFGSCRQKELIFPAETCKIDVHFLWDKAENAEPDGMTLLFYPEDEGGEFWRFEISGSHGGPIEITQGRYTLIAVNNDLPGVRLIDMPYTSAALTALDALYSRTFASQVDMAYVGKVENLKILPGKVSYQSGEGNIISSQSVIDCYPDSVSTIYNIIIRDIEGIEHVKAAEGILEGTAEGIRLSSLTPIEPSVATEFELNIDTEKTSFTGSTSGFPNNTPSAKYGLTLRLAYYGGGGYEKYFDVTEQVLNSFYPHNVYININGLTLPDEPTIEPDEVGMRVDVDGWKVIEIDIDSENY